MYAKRLNKVYPINTPQENKAYLDRGFDIYNDEHEIIAYSPGKTVPYSEYAALEQKYNALLQELADSDPEEPPEFDPDKANMNALKKFAKQNNFDLGTASKVEDARPIVKAWIADQSAGNNDPGADDGSEAPKFLNSPDPAAPKMG